MTDSCLFLKRQKKYQFFPHELVNLCPLVYHQVVSTVCFPSSSPGTTKWIHWFPLGMSPKSPEFHHNVSTPMSHLIPDHDTPDSNLLIFIQRQSRPFWTIDKEIVKRNTYVGVGGIKVVFHVQTQFKHRLWIWIWIIILLPVQIHIQIQPRRVPPLPNRGYPDQKKKNSSRKRSFTPRNGIPGQLCSMWADVYRHRTGTHLQGL